MKEDTAVLVSKSDGQRLPIEIFGAIAKILKDEQQDRTCARLNIASRHIHYETLPVLWSHVAFTLPRVRKVKSLWRPKKNIGWLSRFIVAGGAKRIRYLFLRDSNKTQCRNASDIANLYLEPCAIPKTMKAIVSHIDGDGLFANHFRISIHQGFSPRSRDMAELMAHFNADRNVLGITDDTSDVTVLLRGLAPSAEDSTPSGSDSVLSHLSYVNLGVKRVCLSNSGGPWLDKTALRAIFDDFFCMLHYGVMKSAGKARLEVVVRGFNADDSIMVCQAFKSAIDRHPEYALVYFSIQSPGVITSANLKNIADQLRKSYIRSRSSWPAGFVHGDDVVLLSIHKTYQAINLKISCDRSGRSLVIEVNGPEGVAKEFFQYPMPSGE